MVTNYIEASLGRASYSLWTSLAKGKSWISKCLEDQVSNTWIFGSCVAIETHAYY